MRDRIARFGTWSLFVLVIGTVSVVETNALLDHTSSRFHPGEELTREGNLSGEGAMRIFLLVVACVMLLIGAPVMAQDCATIQTASINA
jgi:hypothetical protein